jgi:hypothetical protein
MSRLDVDGDGLISLDEFLKGASTMQNKFGVSEDDHDHTGW